MSNSTVEFAITSPQLSEKEKHQLVHALQSRFNDKQRREELATPVEDGGQYIIVPDGPSKIDRYICFAPQAAGGVGRIDMYKEEAGCGGESNRLHSNGYIEYRIA